MDLGLWPQTSLKHGLTWSGSSCLMFTLQSRLETWRCCLQMRESTALSFLREAGIRTLSWEEKKNLWADWRQPETEAGFKCKAGELPLSATCPHLLLHKSLCILFSPQAVRSRHSHDAGRGPSAVLWCLRLPWCCALVPASSWVHGMSWGGESCPWLSVAMLTEPPFCLDQVSGQWKLLWLREGWAPAALDGRERTSVYSEWPIKEVTLGHGKLRRRDRQGVCRPPAYGGGKKKRQTDFLAHVQWWNEGWGLGRQ